MTAVWFALPVAEIVVAVIGLPILLKAFSLTFQTWEMEEPEKFVK